MTVDISEWLFLIEREYLGSYISSGGGVVKFVVGGDRQLAEISQRLPILAERHGLANVSINAASTKLHMIQDVFFAIARSLDWDAMVQRFVEALFHRQGYEWPRQGEPVLINEVANHNQIDAILLRRDFHQWLTAEVMNSAEMAQDFRIAITRLCQRRLEPEDAQIGVTAPVLEWLQGELRRVGDLKGTFISAKITRHNGRAMLRSLCHWLRMSGQRGICVILDIRQLSRVGASAGAGMRYSTAAVMDAFEVLRQLIDDSEHFTGLLLVVLADDGLIGDGQKRSVHAYRALQERIWYDVRPEGRDNPLAPLVELPIGSTADPTDTRAAP